MIKLSLFKKSLKIISNNIFNMESPKIKYNNKHKWEIKILNPATKEILDIDICDRIAESKFINEFVTKQQLVNYCYRKSKKCNFIVKKIPIQSNPIA
jgi:hypothetical protein